MSTLTFADTHNMVAVLGKPAESDGFHEIIDFLNANQIRYALTVNPTIYTSWIQQFWATSKAKTVNGKRQIQALIDKKKVIITESSIRSDLHLEDAGVVQPTQDEGVDSGIPADSLQTPMTTQPSSSRSQKKQSKRKQMKDTAVLNLEKTKDAQAKKIADLKKRVQKLERKKKSRTTRLKRLRKVGISRRVESSEDKESLGDHEDASKQGRSIEDIDKDADISLVDETQGRSDDADMFDTDDLHDSAAPTIKISTTDEGVTAAKIDELTLSQTLIEIKAAKPKVVIHAATTTTTTRPKVIGVAPTTIEEITLAQTLIQIKAAKPKFVTTAATTTTTTRPKARGVVVQDPSEFRTPQEAQPSMIKDKGKGFMIEPEVPLKRKYQVASYDGGIF
ncbi:hypothetical protein Tco_1015636 [Tanacetum coccineum]|uniref:Xylulose kinase-1 n=1 Tax=Tanacetum coccineum TaxID=301880 RepID=A0ABQ5FLG6_9ASTR